jgi:TM2 domain-containing membrane protein YozV
MLFILILFFLSTPFHYSQLNKIDFHSQKNIKLFADYLFCDGDYLRAILEYNRLSESNDTTDLKIGLGYVLMNEYSLAINHFSKIKEHSEIIYEAKIEMLKAKFLQKDFKEFRRFYSNEFEHNNFKYTNNGNKLFNFSYFFTDDPLPEKNEFLNPFEPDETEILNSFYDWKNDPPYRSSALAGVMSAIMPGSGKMYVGKWGDGITALLVTGLFAFLAVDNFNAGHNTRAWIFTGLGTFFYAGNIYGSVAAAQIYNAKIAFEFYDGLNLYLEQKNYFTPEYRFCE